MLAQTHAATFVHPVLVHVVQLFSAESPMLTEPHSCPSHRWQTVWLRRLRQIVQIEKYAAQSHGPAHGHSQIRLSILHPHICIQRQLLHASKTNASAGIGGHAIEAGRGRKVIIMRAFPLISYFHVIFPPVSTTNCRKLREDPAYALQ